MTPRPFYRWKSLWFGLLLLGGAVWATVDSRKWMRAVYFAGASEATSVSRENGYTYVEWGRLDWSFVPSHTKRGWGFFRRPATEELDWPEVVSATRLIGRDVFRVADKPILAFLAICWCGWLGWRFERGRLLLKKAA